MISRFMYGRPIRDCHVHPDAERAGPGSETQHDAFAGQYEVRYTGFIPQ